MNEQNIAIAHKFYEARRTLRRLTGEQYAEQIRQWMVVLSQVAEKRGEPVMKAAMHAIGVAQSEGSEAAAVWFMVAMVELIEPDELTPAKAKGDA